MKTFKEFTDKSKVLKYHHSGLENALKNAKQHLRHDNTDSDYDTWAANNELDKAIAHHNVIKTINANK